MYVKGGACGGDDDKVVDVQKKSKGWEKAQG